jgi:uncharacterized protein (TIGR02996 family)
MARPNTTTTTELNLLATVIANPADAVALEVYADYLQEQGAGRAEDEARVRAEAQAIRDGTAPPTFEQIHAIQERTAWAREASAWAERQALLLKRAACAALGDRARLVSTPKGVQLEVDGEVGGLRVNWWTFGSERVTCRVTAYRSSSRLLVRGKRGFNVQTVVAEVLKHVGTGRNRRVEDAARKARYERLTAAIGRLSGQFGLNPRGPLTQGYHTEVLVLKLERPPEEMERLLRLLADNGLLTAAETAPPA